MARLKSALIWVAMLALAGILLYFAFRGVKWQDLVDGIRSCDFRWVIVTTLLSALPIFLRSLRWRILMLPLNPTITRRESFDGISIGYLANFALPRAGEFARCGVISATGKTSYEAVLGTVVLERSFDLLCYALILLAVLLLRWQEFGSFVMQQIGDPLMQQLPFNILWLIAGLILVAIGLLWATYHFRDRLRKFPLLSKLFTIAKGLLDGLAAGFRMPQKGRFFLLTILIWLGYWLMSYTTIQAFPAIDSLNGVDALFLMVVGSLGWIVPVQGGIGAYHFIISLALTSLYAIPQTHGVIFATISHESQALMMLICGIYALISLSTTCQTRQRKPGSNGWNSGV